MLALEEDSANALWAGAWAHVTEHGGYRTHARGNYLDTLHAVLSLRDPRQRWVSARMPAINPAFALIEVIYILRGRSDVEFLLPWNRDIIKFVGDNPTQYGAYGERVRARFGFDQLRQAALVLTRNPEQRQVVLQIWDATSDFPTDEGRSRSRDIPCNVVSMLKLVNGRLEWMQVMRSNDLIRGLPYNFIQWTYLQEVLAGWIGAELGSYVHISDSLHIYEADQAAFICGPPEPTAAAPDLRLSMVESDEVFSELEDAAIALSETDDVVTAQNLSNIVTRDGYQDWTRVLAAERIRRIGDPEAALLMVQSIETEALRRVATSWHEERPGRLAANA